MLVDHVVEEPQARSRRAVIHDCLDFGNPQHVCAWRTVVQAWNVAVQRSVCETGGSIGNLPGSVPVGAYVEQPVDIFLASPNPGEPFPLPDSEARIEEAPEFGFAWDPGDIEWRDLATIVDATHAVRAELQSALLSDDEDWKLFQLKRFAEAVAPHVPGRLKPPIGPWMWALGTVAIRFGVPGNATILAVSALAALGEQAIVEAVNELRDRIIAVRIVESAQALPVYRFNGDSLL